jgi:membrane protease YdiL (CAAX protease family)
MPQLSRVTIDRFSRLQPPVRVGIYAIGCLLASLIWCVCVWMLFRPSLDVWVRPDRFPVTSAVYLAGTYVIWVGGALWTWLALEGETLEALRITGNPLWARQLGLGILLGVVSLLALIGLELATQSVIWGDAAWRHTPWTVFVTAGATSLFFGATEELLFRGFVYQTLRKGWGRWASVAASGWFYAAVHFLRLDLGWMQILTPFLGLWLAGALLAWTVERTRSLWWAMGLHVGWVYIFYIADRQHLLGYPASTAWITGGGFPLGGALALLMLAALWLLLANGLAAGYAKTPV